MVDVDKMSDAELRTKLLEFGFPVMPITGTTRSVMAKKLKMLLDNKNKINSESGRRSLGRYSSEEESDTDVKATKKKDNRRATMAAPLMQPPASNKLRKSTRLNDIDLESEVPTSPRRAEYKSTVSTTKTTTSRSQKLLKNAQDEFDTGSDSESDIVTNSRDHSSSYVGRYSPVKSTFSSSLNNERYSPSKSADSSFVSSRNISYHSPSLASEYATERLNQIRSRLSLNTSDYNKPYTSSPILEKEETPFLSNFTRRLSALSSNPKTDLDYKNDGIKEHDTNGASAYPRSHLASVRSMRGRENTYSYKLNQSNILKNNFVSFSVLAGAALFFIFLAIMYLGIKSDTSIAPAGTVIPHCTLHDKRGVNCIEEEEVTTAIHLLNVLKPELLKRSVANKCFDVSLKAHMTESEVVNFVRTNFATKDENRIRKDLLNLQILSFNNPEWGIRVVQTEDNNGPISEDDIVETMEKVIFNHGQKVTSLVIFNPELPWRCTFYKTFAMAFNGLVVVALVIGVLYALNVGFKYYKHYVQKQRDEIGFMVEKIIDILQSSVGEENEEKFVVINHVRDMILPVADRKKKEKNWAKAVRFINENESRVRTEVQVVQGEPFEVWRWIGSANLSASGNRSDYIYRQGRRIVDVQHLLSEALGFEHKPLRFCRGSDLEIKNEVRDGFLSVFLLSCRRCRRERAVCSEDPNNELMDVNQAFVAGIVSQRLSLYHLNELCGYMQIPGLTRADYEDYLDKLYELYNEKSVDTSKSSVEGRESRSPTPQETKDASLESEESVFESKKREFLKQLEKSPEEIKTLCELTVGQRDCPLWFEERKKRLTASNFGRIFKLLDTTNRRKVAYDLLHSNFRGNVYTQYGQDNEKKALEAFEKLTKLKVTSCGLFVHPEHPFLAATPDGLIGDDAIVEVKCPYKSREETPEKAVRKNLILFGRMNKGAFNLQTSHPYYMQVQGQLYVTGREFCYFVVWSPHGLMFEKIGRDEDCWGKMFPKLEDFYFKHFLPLLLREEQE